MPIITRILSSVDHFQTLQQLVGLDAEVTKFVAGMDKGHLEGRISEIGSPKGRESFTEELEIRIGKDYLRFEMYSYQINDAYKSRIAVFGYLDNGSKVMEITAYTGNSQ